MPAAGELRCVDAAIESVLEDIDSAFILKEEHRTWSQAQKIDSTPKRSLHGAGQPGRSAALQPPAASSFSAPPTTARCPHYCQQIYDIHEQCFAAGLHFY
ncbi:unnamed protein product [Pleuronectes platessa]|uniref:Uncharacterized protein n=1 Tax=Pleuronectes platessa TaxID=8262 RepID=A0A9N7YAB0_PLEPL|nr:unnamed protein product [Pleuronectes platessa]